MNRDGSRSAHYLIILVAGTLLFIPSLWVGFLIDDYYYLGAVEGRFPDHDTSRSLFTFFINDEEATARIAAEGGYPWWIDESVRSRVLRPLSDLLFRIDHSMYGRSALGYHLHSLVWWALTLGACGLLFRRVLPGAVGLLALLIFAVDEVHVIPVSWISNRNALVSLAPMLVGLWAWIRWREDGWRAGRVVGPISVAIGLAGGELGVAVVAYVLSYELLGAQAPSLRSRLSALAPLVAVGLAYVLVYKLLGYGGAGSGLYLDPVRNPLGFLEAALTRIPALLAGAIVGFSADLWFFNPAARTAQVLIGCGSILGLLVLLRWIWSDLDENTRRALRWLLPGSIASLIPIAATFPSDRMLLVPGIGIVAALAAVILRALESWRARRPKSLIVIGGALALGHLMLAPIMAIWIQSVVIKQNRGSLRLAASSVVRDSGGKDTILVFVPDYMVSLYMPLLIDHVGGPAPKSWRPLSIAPCDHWLRRTGPRTLELETANGAVMMRSIFEELYRSPKKRLTAGTIVDRGLFKAEILNEAAEGPTRIAFHFGRDLDDSTLRFLVWKEGELRLAEIPKLGGEVYLKRTLGPAGF